MVIDTPGSDTHLSRLAHTWADTLLTPLNDSFIDLDLLARIDPETLKIVRPSVYAEAVWKQRQIRSMQGARPVDWIVMRNRLSSLAARNKRDMGTVIEALAKRIGFRVAAGLSERVIYRELFLNGLTLLDLKRGGGGVGPSLTMSHVAARQEVRDLVAALNLPPPDARRAIGRPRDSSSHARPRQLQDEQGAERPGVAVRRIAGRPCAATGRRLCPSPIGRRRSPGRPRDCCWC